MKHSVLAICIIVARIDELPWSTEDIPEIGFFKVVDTTLGGQDPTHYALIYADDIITGYHGDRLKYATGFLSNSNAWNITEAADLRRGGGVPLQRSIDVSIRNTSNLRENLLDMGLVITGKECYIVEYTWIDSDPVSGTGLFYGIADEIRWDETALKFKVTPTIEDARRANIMHGDLPVSFGNTTYSLNKRVGDPFLLSHWIFTGNDNHRDIVEFEVVNATSSPFLPKDIIMLPTAIHSYEAGSGQQRQWIRLRLAGDRDTDPDNSNDNYPQRLTDALFMSRWQGDDWNSFYAVDADAATDAERAGQPVERFAVHFDVNGGARRVSATTSAEILVVLERPFIREIVVGDRINFVRQDVTFQADGWPTARLQSDGTASQLAARVAFYPNGEDMLRLRQYGTIEDWHYQFGVKPQRSPGGNYVQQRAIFTRETDGVNNKNVCSYVRLPANNLSPLRTLTIEGWNTSNLLLGKYASTVYGLYYDKNAISSVVDITNHTHNIENATDGDYSTYAETISEMRVINAGIQVTALSALRFTLPPPPPTMRGDNAYIAVKMTTVANAGETADCEVGSVVIHVRERRNVVSVNNGRAIDTFSDDVENDPYGIISNAMDDPTEFPFPQHTDPEGVHGTYDPFLSTNVRYHRTVNGWTDTYRTSWTGYRMFKIDGIDMHSRNIKEGLLMIFAQADRAPNRYLKMSTKIYDIGVLYEDVVDISEGLYSAVPGRLIDDSWGNRRTPNQLLNDPVDIIEHARRLSNFEETRFPYHQAGFEWGKKYLNVFSAWMALIDTAAFDTVPRHGVPAGRQIISESDADTDAIVNSVSNDFYFLSVKRFVNEQNWLGTFARPHESITSIVEPMSQATIPLITKSEYESIGILREPAAADIICEPIIKYNYCHGTGTYLNEMAVTNVNAATWRPEYTRGFANDQDAQELWGECKRLFDLYRVITPMPQNMREQKWINHHITALWKMREIITWGQRTRVEIVVPWEVGRLWAVGTHINLSAPHIVGGAPLLCVCESVAKNRRTGKVTCGLIYIDSTDVPSWDEINETGSAASVVIEVPTIGASAININETGKGGLG